MKKLVAAATFGLAVAVSAAMAADGKAIFQSKGCAACHNPTVKTVGPSLKQIAQAYNGDEAALIKFLKGEAKPKVDPAMFATMKPQLNTTKALSDDELKALAQYILSNK